MIKEGDVFTSNQGHTAIVLEYKNVHNIVVKYSSGRIETCSGGNLRAGKFKDKGLPTVLGIGILGYESDVEKSSYTAWYSMLQRVYAPQCEKTKRVYEGCSVDSSWLYYQVFKKWYDGQIKEVSWQLEKDLLVKNNKVYSPDRCVMVPQELNKFLVSQGRHREGVPTGVYYQKQRDKWVAQVCIEGKHYALGRFDTSGEAFLVYKSAKEAEAKRLAEKWCKIVDPRVTTALLNFEVSNMIN